MAHFFFLLVGCALLAPSVTHAEEPYCSLTRHRNVSFREPRAADVLTVSIGHGPCYLAEFRIEIRTDMGELLYEYRMPFSELVALPLRDPKVDYLPALTADLVSSALKDMNAASQRLRAVNRLESYEVLAVTNEVYEDLWRRDVPIFWHWDKDGARMIAYDKALGRGIVVSCFRSEPNDDCGTSP